MLKVIFYQIYFIKSYYKSSLKRQKKLGRYKTSDEAETGKKIKFNVYFSHSDARKFLL